MSAEDVFWPAHEGLPREAPGSPATSRLLLQLAGPVAERPRIVDIGAGTGPASLLLAAETGGEVVSVDLHEPFLERLRAAAAASGLADRVSTLTAPMQDLPLPDGSADLVWAEGSAYLMGFDAALAAWRRLLAPGGVLVLTECEWTTTEPSAGAREFWDHAYPAMRTTDGNVRAALEAGWTVAATYLLPDSDWAAYYDPLTTRIDTLRAEGADATSLNKEALNKEALNKEALDKEAREIDIRRAHGADYGYTGYVLRPR